MSKLVDNFEVSGQDFKTFSDIVSSIDESTFLKTMKSDETDVLSYINEDDDFLYFSVLPSTDNIRQMIIEKRPIKKLRLKKASVESDLIAEVKEIGLMLRFGGVAYFTSKNLMQTLSQRMGLGTSVFEPSLERDAFIARCFGSKPFIMNALTRTDKSSNKIFAVFSNRYIREEQAEIFEKIRTMQCEGCECTGFTVNNFKTSIQFSFKEEGGFIPGLCFQTSDTGTISSKVFATVQRNSAVIPLQEYCIPHRKGYSFFETIEEYEEIARGDIKTFLKVLSGPSFSLGFTDYIVEGLGKKPTLKLKEAMDSCKGGSLIEKYDHVISFLKKESFGEVNTLNTLKKLGEYPAYKGGTKNGKAVV